MGNIVDVPPRVVTISAFCAIAARTSVMTTRGICRFSVMKRFPATLASDFRRHPRAAMPRLHLAPPLCGRRVSGDRAGARAGYAVWRACSRVGPDPANAKCATVLPRCRWRKLEAVPLICDKKLIDDLRKVSDFEPGYRELIAVLVCVGRIRYYPAFYISKNVTVIGGQNKARCAAPFSTLVRPVENEIWHSN